MVRGLEILELKAAGEYWQVRTALNGRLAVPFEFPKSVRAQFPSDDAFEQYLGRQTLTMLDAFGDARENRVEANPEFVV